MKNITLYSNQPILAEGLRKLVENIEGFALTAVCPDAEVVVDHLLRAGCPDVLVLDVTLAVTLGALQRLKAAAPAAAILLWIDALAPEFATQALQMGVRGFLSKKASLDLHVECLREIARGELWIQPEISRKLLCVKQTRLTPRERQLMGLLAQGLKNKEIAWQLQITEGTVKVYLSHLFRKVGASDRLDLALMALRNLAPNQTGGFDPVRPAGVEGEISAVMPRFIGVTRETARIQ